MGLDAVFLPCRFTGIPVVKTNPFTGAEQTVVPHEPLNATELHAVRHVLTKAEAEGPDENGDYVIQSGDSGVAEVAADDLENGCMVTLRGMTSEIEQFLFDLLGAAEWVMHPAMDDFISITTSPNGVKDLPNYLPRPVYCKTPKELGVLFSNGVRAWEKYRDQIASEG